MEWAKYIKPQLPVFIAEGWDANSKAPDAEKEDDFAMCLAEKMTEEDFKLVRYSRFYMALMANCILKETPIPEICAIFGNCNRGIVQTCQQMTMNFAGMMSAFCERLRWTDYSALFMRINAKINWQV